MDYWPSARWKIGLTTGQAHRWVEPTLPFALIGADECCLGRVDEKRVAPVVYLACCFDDSVEVWPVRPIAFARWGIAEPSHELMVGQTRVTLVHQTHVMWPQISDDSPRIMLDADHTPTGLHVEPLPEITLQWGGKSRKKLLPRRVTIIGQDHPSTLRMYGMGMRRCDHAIVAVGDWIGLINMAPPAGTPAEDLVTRLLPETPAITLGSVRVSLGNSDVADQAAVAPTSDTDGGVPGTHDARSESRETVGGEDSRPGTRKSVRAPNASAERAEQAPEEDWLDWGSASANEQLRIIPEGQIPVLESAALGSGGGIPPSETWQEQVDPGRVDETADCAVPKEQEVPCEARADGQSQPDGGESRQPDRVEADRSISPLPTENARTTVPLCPPATRPDQAKSLPRNDQTEATGPGVQRSIRSDSGARTERGPAARAVANRAQESARAVENAVTVRRPAESTKGDAERRDPINQRSLDVSRIGPQPDVHATNEVKDREALSSRLTDRLIAIDGSKSMKRRVIVQSAYTAAFIVTGLILAWLIIWKIMPMIGG